MEKRRNKANLVLKIALIVIIEKFIEIWDIDPISSVKINAADIVKFPHINTGIIFRN